MRPRVISVVLLACLCVGPAKAKRSHLLHYVGGGPVVAWLGSGFDALRPWCDSLDMVPFDPGGGLSVSGTGFIQVGNRLRLGGLGGGRAATTSARLSIPEQTNSLAVDFDWGGVYLEYLVPIRDCAFAVGALAGVAHIDLVRTHAETPRWRDFFDPGSPGSWQRTVSATCFGWQPHVAFEWAPYPYLALRIQAGYLGAIFPSRSWRELGQAVAGAPGLDLSGFTVSFTPVLGF